MELNPDTRLDQIRTISQIARVATHTSDIDRMLQQVVTSIVDQLGYYHAAVYLIDPTGNYAVLHHAGGASHQELIARGFRVAIGSNSVIGWVTANNQVYSSEDVSADPLHYHNELLPLTRSEVGLPISNRGQIIGAMDVHSSTPAEFDDEIVSSLQVLSDQIAAIVLTQRLLESTEADLEGFAGLFQASRDLAAADDETRVHDAVRHSANHPVYSSVYYLASKSSLVLHSFNKPGGEDSYDETVMKPEPILSVTPESILEPGIHRTGVQIVDTISDRSQHKTLQNLAIQLGWSSFALLPLEVDGKLVSLLVLGAKQRTSLTQKSTSPYRDLMDIAAYAIKKARLVESSRKQEQKLIAVAQVVRDLNAGEAEAGSFRSTLTDGLIRLGDAFAWQHAAVYLAGKERDILRLEAISGDVSPGTDQTLLPADDGIVGQSFTQMRPLIQAFESGSTPGVPDILSVFPVMHRKMRIGVLMVVTDPSRGLSTTDEEFLNLFCNALALVGANQQIVQRQQRLFDVISRISRSAGMEEVMKTAVHEVGGFLGARRAQLRVGVSSTEQTISGVGTNIEG